MKKEIATEKDCMRCEETSIFVGDYCLECSKNMNRTNMQTKETAKHTPGQLVVVDAVHPRQNYAIAVKDGDGVAYVIGCGPKARAYADLFAAAPELLEACRQAQTWLSCSSDDGDLEMYNLLDAAIAKAEGR